MEEMNDDADDMLSKKIRIYIFSFAGLVIYFPLLIYLLDKCL